MTILGIDVGMTGALAFYHPDDLVIYDMPVNKRNKTKRVDCRNLFAIVSSFDVEHAFIEQVNAYGMGATGAYNFGWSCGSVEAVIASAGIPFTYVTPQKWKKAMSCPKDKDASRMRASQLLPRYADLNWPLKKHHGRAEAALIALYGHKNS